MSNLFRSETMVYTRMVMSEETSYDTIKQLGVFGKAHIVDLSARGNTTGAPNDRTSYFKKRVASASYYERKLQSFTHLFQQYHVSQPSIDIEPQSIPPGGDILETTKTFLEPLESTLTKNILYGREQRLLLNTLQENLAVLQVLGGVKPMDGKKKNSKVGSISTQSGGAAYGTFVSEESSLLRSQEEEETEDVTSDAIIFDEEKGEQPLRRVPYKPHFMSTLNGIIQEEKIILFERMIFRLSRGNVVTKIITLDEKMFDPLDPTGPKIGKAVFQLTFVGTLLEQRLKKVLQHFGGVEYELPTDQNERIRQAMKLHSQIRDAEKLLTITETQICSNLKTLVWDSSKGSSPFIDFMYALRVEKGIADTLKKCEPERPGSMLLKLEAWLPEKDVGELQTHLRQAVVSTGLQAAACEVLSAEDAVQMCHATPPTYFELTKFTTPYQGIVDTYGVPRYKEVNPGLFTIISFPFLFGVMYGDIGHGTLLTLGALWFIWNEKYYNNLVRYGQMDEIMGMVFGGRYMLVAMGMFAVYAGFIYNDCFSIPLNLFGTRWKFGSQTNSVAVSEGVYPFGIDPNWYHTTNELAFFNSLKMKLAVTLGVAQMTFGIVLGAFNNTYFGDKMALVFEFLPRLVFMLSTFGYMIFLIIYKLSIDWSTSSVAAPNLVQTMIAMFLSPGQVDADKQLYAGQGVIQALLLLLALVSVPVMLLAQPLIARAQHNAIYGTPSSNAKYDRLDRAAALAESKLDSDDTDSNEGEDRPTPPPKVETHEEGGGGHGPDPRSPHYSFADHAITQGIHTIEFVLGAVSNTASYLRLWALSLAHAELSDVFWKKMISQYGLETGNPWLMVVGMAAWAGATFAVLLAMDVLECFLHALRLHWVEFQNKFYHADGVAYKPFSYSTTEVQE